MPSQGRPTVLVIGGSDSSGGAGITRDLRTLADLQVGGIAAITAVTAQTNAEVRGVQLVSPSLVREQVSAALSVARVGAIKIGMLGTKSIVEAVAASLPSRDEIPIVLDPVLAATSGRELLDDGGRRAMIETLLPNVTVLTPNIPEAAALLGEPVARDECAMQDFGARLLQLGPRAVLVKGGHSDGDEAVDLLQFPPAEIVRLRSPRMPGLLRGTGCALASAIAAGLARRRSLTTACREAKHYVASQFDAAL